MIYGGSIMSVGSSIGIDFGTTNTSVVRIDKNSYGEKMTILGEDGEFPFASLLAVLPDNRVEFGNKVKSKRDEYSEKHQLVSSLKSLLGTNKKVVLNGIEFTPSQIVTQYFKCLKQYIKQKHGIQIEEVSLSFPVDFTAKARFDLRLAAERAGLKVKYLVSESTAAYLATCKNVKGLSRIMVIDWGGGTLDISILESEGSKLREVSVFGEKIGGDDIDTELAQRVHSVINLKTADSDKRLSFSEMPASQRDKIVSRCEEAKIQISEDGDEYPLTLRNYGDYGTKTIPISSDMFEDIVKPIIRNRVLKTINSAMERAELTKSSIDAVIIAGGSSNLRPFADAITNLFGRDKIIIPDKVQFVSAKGAALMPFIGGEFKLSDDVGIVMSDNTIFPILHKNKDGVGSKSNRFTFSLTEDSPDAHFIITNGDGRIVYDKMNIPTKGFLQERLEVTAEIDKDQIANIKIHNNTVADELKDSKIKIHNLTFYYDLSAIGK